MTGEQIIMLVVIGVYLVGMVVIGIISARKTSNIGDFYLGGRKLGPLVTAMSAEASDMSSWLLMGLPGVAYATGIADAGWTALGLALGTYVNWLIVAKRLRKYSHVCGDSITIPDFFSNRFRDNSRMINLISALIILVFFIPYTGSGFAACGKLFNSLFGMDYHLAMIISAIVIIAYTAIGGFLAASTTDFIQSIIMIIALIVVVIFGITQAGGMGAVIDYGSSLPGYFSVTHTFDALNNAAKDYNPLQIASTFAWGLGYFGMPHILLRFMAINDPDKIKTSRRVATVWVFISLAVAIFIGVVGLAMSNHAHVIDPLADPETVVVTISSLLSTFGPLAAIVAGLIIAGILASTMSTSDSQLLAASSSMSENIIGKVFGLKLSEKTSMLIARITVIVIAIVGIIIAWDPNSSVFEIVSFAWAGFGATFGPVMLAALFWKRSNRTGALCGLITGGITVFVWKFLIAPMGGLWNIYELLPAFIVGFVTIVVVSLYTKAPSEEIVAEFESISEKKA